LRRRNEELKNNMKKSGLKKQNDKKTKEKGRIKEINMQPEKEILRST
jgi:hypothetical protein